jgi:hypothetical protein
MTTGTPNSLPAAVAETDGGTIVSPINPTIMYLGSVYLPEEHRVLLTYGTQAGLEVDLRYNQTWLKASTPTTLVVELPPGWSLAPKDEKVSWVGSAPIWIGQIVATTIQEVVTAKTPGFTVESDFVLFDPVNNRRIDPAVVVRQDG